MHRWWAFATESAIVFGRRAIIIAMPTNPLTATTRAVFRPVRTFFNLHFESVKDEVRQRNGDQTAAIASIVEDVLLPAVEAVRAEVNGLAEQQRCAIALENALVELRQTNDQLLAVLAEFVKRPDQVSQPTPD